MKIGIDLGGTKTEIVALDQDGQELLRRRVPTPAQNYPDIVETIAKLVEEAESKLQQTGSVGVGIPGAVSHSTGLIKNANTTCLIGHALDQDLQLRLKRPIRLANDANCFTLSEASDGAAQNAAVVFGVILGTGVGGGVVISGKILEGRNSIAGEWGHNPLPWPNTEEQPGPLCYCGKYGCIETFLSGPGLKLDYKKTTGGDLSPESIVSAALSGDKKAIEVLERYEDRLSRALATVVNLLDPDVIVLGGGLSQMERLYSVIPRKWTQYIFSDSVETRLVRAQYGDSSGVRGAAWLW